MQVNIDHFETVASDKELGKGPFWTDDVCKPIAANLPYATLEAKSQPHIFDGAPFVKNVSFINPGGGGLSTNVDRAATPDLFNAIKIRLYPNIIQRAYFEECFGAHRYFYNASVEEWSTYDPEDKKKPINEIALRTMLIPTEDNMAVHEQWMKRINASVRRGGLETFVAMQHAAVSNEHNVKAFAFLEKSNPRQVFHAAPDSILYTKGQIKMFTQKLKEYKFFKIDKRGRSDIDKHFPNGIDREYIVLKDHNQYYLCLPYIAETREYDDTVDDFIALDPGINTFQSYYSTKTSGKLGTNLSDMTERIHRKIKQLQRIRCTVNNRKKKGIDRKCMRLRAKARNIVDNFQWHCVNWLTKNFKVILLPRFSMKYLKVSSPVMRRGLSLRHATFAQKLEHRVMQCKDRVLIRCSESYTSKTCGLCGNIDNELGKGRVYNCKTCNQAQDRDIHAARNILMKCLSIEALARLTLQH